MAAPGAEEPSGEGDAAQGQCSICLEEIAWEDHALVPDCGHAEHCLRCLLTWASYSFRNEHGDPRCPQCKELFSHIALHRSLDGALSDWPVIEPVNLLLRAPWFVPATRHARHTIFHSDSTDPTDDLDDAEAAAAALEEQEASRRSRKGRRSGDIVLGNRPYGRGGFMSAGRTEARPARPNKQSKDKQRRQQQQQQQSQKNESTDTKGKQRVDEPGAGEENATQPSDTNSRPVSAARAKRQAKEEKKLAKEQAKAERRRQELGLSKEGGKRSTKEETIGNDEAGQNEPAHYGSNSKTNADSEQLSAQADVVGMNVRHD